LEYNIINIQIMPLIQHARKLGPVSTAAKIVQKEGALALYKGLGAVVSGIVPKMAIRFWSFEAYKEVLKGDQPNPTLGQTFFGKSSLPVFVTIINE
jgi:hypothetical protein